MFILTVKSNEGLQRLCRLHELKNTTILYAIITCFHVMDNILLHITGREVGHAESERKWNVSFFNFHSSYFSLSSYTQYGTRKVSTIMEGNKCCAPVIEISGNVFHPLPIP